MIETQFVLFKSFVVAMGIVDKPSSFLEQLDFIDSPNIRIQVYKWSAYVFIDSVRRNVERNKKKVTLASEYYQKGFLAGQLDVIQRVSTGHGRA